MKINEMSEWIEKIRELYYRGHHIQEIMDISFKIDALLRRAMYSTDDESLNDDIRKVVDGTD